MVFAQSGLGPVGRGFHPLPLAVVQNGLRLRLGPVRISVPVVTTAVVLALVVLSGCKVDLTVTVASDALGAGRIGIDAVLDREAASALVPPSAPMTTAPLPASSSSTSPTSFAFPSPTSSTEPLTTESSTVVTDTTLPPASASVIDTAGSVVASSTITAETATGSVSSSVVNATTSNPSNDSIASTVPTTVVRPAVQQQGVRIDDLRKAGWEGPGVQRRADGSATFSVHHRFTTVREGNELLAQLSTPDGPFGQLTLRRQRSPLNTTITLQGPGDFRQGLASFGDAKLAQLTGSGAFGVTDAEVLRQADAASIDDVLRVTVVSELVGSRASWQLPVGKATPMSASGRQRHWATIGGFGAAIVTLALYVGLRSRKETK